MNLNNTTKFKNKISLFKQTLNGEEEISFNEDIILNFPYKNSILVDNINKDNEGIFINKEDTEKIEEIFKKREFKNLLRVDGKTEEKINTLNIDENGDIKDNLLLKGNNLIGLNSLLNKFENKVKLIYIDPPYNTQKNSFGYNDTLEHSTWLIFMKNRLEIARKLLKEDGLIYISINELEVHYLKVMMDEIFGRENFIADLIWQQFHSVKNDAKYFSKNNEHILVYGKNLSKSKVIIKNETFEKNEQYKYDDNDGKGKYKLSALTAKSGKADTKRDYTFSNGITYTLPSGVFWRYSFDTLKELEKNNKIYFNSKGVPYYKRHLSEVKEGKKVSTIWMGNEVGYSITGDKEIKDMFGQKIFINPKPEKLLKRIIEISTEKGDLVLDFFAGSGTTCAVAHKMNRQYIGIEQMDYIETITKERLKNVINGEQGGVSKELDWKGGFEFVFGEI